MKNHLLNERAFTLIEMMIVLAIITILLLIIVPNITKNSNVANEKSCDATIKMVQGQIGVYIAEHNGEQPDSINDLKPYLEAFGDSDDIACPDGTPLTLNNDGKVVKGSRP